MTNRSITYSFPFNPNVLRWARDRAEYSEIEVANLMKIKDQKIIYWETKKSNPTINQARKMAEIYGRPFLEFFAKKIPEIPETNLVPDFRMKRNNPINHENKILREVQEWGESQRLNALDLFEINGTTPPKLPKELKATVSDNPEKAAENIRLILNFSIEEQINIKAQQKLNLVKQIKARLEAIGILILKNSDLVKCKARGMCIYNEILPIIVLGKEAPNGSTFTLIHEFAHIILRQSAVSDGLVLRSGQINSIETWCNQFTGAFLIPQQSLLKFFNPQKSLADISDENLKWLASKFAVSRHAMLVRLVQLGLVDPEYYWQVKRSQFIEEENNQTSGGRNTYYGSRYRNRNGDLYTGLVLEAWSNNRITNHNAAEFMGIKNITHLFDIRKHFND